MHAVIQGTAGNTHIMYNYDYDSGCESHYCDESDVLGLIEDVSLMYWEEEGLEGILCAWKVHVQTFIYRSCFIYKYIWVHVRQA